MIYKKKDKIVSIEQMLQCEETWDLWTVWFIKVQNLFESLGSSKHQV